MQLETFDKYRPRVLRVALALLRLEDRQQHATYEGLRYVLSPPAGELLTHEAVYQAVGEAIEAGLVEVVRDSNGRVKKVFGLTAKGREALRA